MHSARWDESYDFSVSNPRNLFSERYANPVQGKKAAVIGNGSSGIQIVPAMLPKVTHLDHYIRGQTWLSPTFARDEVDKRGAGLENCKSPCLESNAQ